MMFGRLLTLQAAHAFTANTVQYVIYLQRNRREPTGSRCFLLAIHRAARAAPL